MIDLTQEKQEILIKNRFLAKVFGLMSIGLLISAIFAYATSENQTIRAIIFSNSMSFMAIILIQFGLVYAISGALNKISSNTATALFLLYSALTGVTLSSIFIIYTQGSIVFTFGITAGTFLGMSVYGYTTTTDLTKIGSYLIMGLWGIIIASLVNIFFRSSGLNFLISILGVIIFTGLTAYDVQNIAKMDRMLQDDTEVKNRMAVVASLKLYLDFINLFLYLLRFLGQRRND
ncbi:Bax inhibitor-1/YccA family protein [Borreliella lusitaniae]|uniref:Bax inhibitor-1/YccA family protein n=1 Tax=Borreliella lusitaniae TaxID=100177 RepID=A0ABZ0CHS5_9SPIR|nr:Bax inhibitor-1/YccA family protein [Borreliella lusitaniae]WKC85441.1 Bax inhibitor-1/YccA family protein [Borreliella lusitaniae]WNY68731.1 Bax inhibitor-1/YccA family protein [Borreliella lusitaniae]